MNEERSGGGDMDEKKSFVLYQSHWEILEELPLESFKKVMQAAWSLVGACDMPDLDLLERTAFKPIKNDILNNANKWESTRKKRAEAGRKGGKATQAKQSNAKQTEATLSDDKQNQANQAVDGDVDVDVDADVDGDVDVVSNKTLCASDDAPCAKNEKKTEPSKTDIDNHYNALWDRYPKKKGKSAVSATKRRKLMKVSLDEMERAVERYRKDCENESFPRELMDGSTWFNGRYEDYLDATYETNRTTSTDYLDYLIRKDLEHKDDDDDEGWSYGSI